MGIVRWNRYLQAIVTQTTPAAAISSVMQPKSAERMEGATRGMGMARN
jgi:hypothetical protein